MKVLVTDGSSGQAHGAVSAVRTLARAGHEVDVTVSGRHSMAGWSRHSRRQHPVPSAEHAAYAEAVRGLVESESYGVVFPASDAALIRLGWPGAELVDKQQLHHRAESVGLPTPTQRRFEHGDAVLEAAGELGWPVAVKALAKSTDDAVPVFRADSVADLAALRGLTTPVVVEEWLTGEQRATCGVVWNGRLRAVVHQRYVRSWPRECGIAAYAVSCPPDADLESRLVQLLEGYNGVFQCQLIDGRLHDLNPRVYGSLVLPARAGVNLLDVVCRLTAGEDVGAGAPLRVRPDVAYRWVEGDLRHLREARRSGDLSSGAVLRALTPRRGTAHPDVWLSDPGPVLARLMFARRARRAAR